MFKPGDVSNFETLKKAFAGGDVALMECTNNQGEYVAVICAVQHDQDTGVAIVTPFAKLFAGNPYEEVTPLGGNDGE